MNKLYTSINKLNVHDHVICGCSLKKTQIKYLSIALIQQFHQNWAQIQLIQLVQFENGFKSIIQITLKKISFIILKQSKFFIFSQSYNSNLNLLNSFTLLLSNESLIKFNINNQLKQVINKFTNIKFLDFKSTIYQEKYFWIGFYLLQYQENEILLYLTSQQMYEKLKNNISHLCSLIKIQSKYNNASAFFTRLRSYENPKPYIFISLFKYIIKIKNNNIIIQLKFIKNITKTSDYVKIQILMAD
ncbi:unnamed protein product [Paramecium primaurelia]|uniref:Uncharacterized protein n=1 Tax=Paramecium primaurelia TaxID=5886 RepID=A0A8S1L125_PARPR|nr:unnamed protein product [Paramecium primaurelia]